MSAVAHMKLLVNLARIDGHVEGPEKAYIFNIGKAIGIPREEIVPWFEQEHEVAVPTNLSDDQRFDFVFTLVQLMKTDEKMFKEEIVFCSKIAEKLGYDREVLFELLLNVKPEPMTPEQISSLKSITQKHLKH